jgi:hypothetical protein
MCPTSAVANSGMKLSACTLAQPTTQRRFEPKRAMHAGAINCSTAPAKIGTLAINPATTCPVPSAKANAGK